MPLVEIVRAAHSDDASLATAIGLTSRIGKTPVLVSDSAGFLVNRILTPYLAEALVLAGEGAPIRQIDDALKDWGMPMGPFELLDEIGLDIAAHVLKSLAGKTPPPENVAGLFDRAKALNWLGKKSGKGFYVYTTRRRRSVAPRINGELTRTLIDQPQVAALDAESIQLRLVLPMVNESARVLEDGVTDASDAIDLATVLGLGLAPFRGGIAHFAASVGAEEIVRRLDDLTARLGARFAPARSLREAAHGHQSIAPTAQTQATQPTEHAVHF
jgi:3-hydroxyacyl-CoA dehydrogenase/enoyl-CoA hydratase/3-hydroxybutyryl-CoA epimerase